MLTASTALVDEITSASQVPVQQLTLDRERSGTPVDMTGYSQSINITRSLTTDLPDGARLVNGYGAASATVDLGGDKTNNEHDGAWTFAPTNTDSPWYGKKRVGAPFIANLGYNKGTLADPNNGLLRRFTGWTSTLNTDSQERTAELQCVDGAGRLRTQVLLPLATNLGHPSLDSRFFIDYILTANGIDPDDCDLEESLNPLTTTPGFSGDKQDAWTLIQAIAAAEYATAFFDSNNKFHFWNREHFTRQAVNYAASTVTVNGVTNPIPEITTARNVFGLTTTETDQAIKNHIVVSFTPYAVQPEDWVWQGGGQGLHSGQTITLYPSFDNPVQTLSTDVVLIPFGGDTGGKSGYRACTTKDGTGEPIENLVFTVTEFAQHAKVTIHNPNKTTAFLVSPKYNSKGDAYPEGTSPGTAMLWLRGRAITQDANFTSATNGSTGASVEAMDAASMDPVTGVGEQLLEVDGGGWIQNSDTAQTLAYFLLKLLRRPVPYLGDVSVIADPRLELGDRIQLVDGTGTKLTEHAWIVAITETFTAGSSLPYSQTLTLRLCNAIGGWILGHPTRSRLGSTTVLSGVY